MPSTDPFRWYGLAGAVTIALLPAPVLAETSTRLVSCPSGDCLLVSGRRADPAVPVLLNGHAVTAEGGRKWRVRLPLDTLRRWSAARARTIRVTLPDPRTREDKHEEAPLPIGLLGDRIDLAALVVRVR